MQSRTWSELSVDELYAFLKLRTDVFFVEQKVDEEELDNRDQEPSTIHLWVMDAAGTAAYLRVLVDDVPSHLDARHIIGRVVVREDRRGEGLAQLLIEEALRAHLDVAFVLHAQTYVTGLYGRYGFAVDGDDFIEAGIPHVTMYRPAGRIAASTVSEARTA